MDKWRGSSKYRQKAYFSFKRMFSALNIKNQNYSNNRQHFFVIH